MPSNKFFNIPTEINGIKFHSKFEAAVYLNAPDLVREPLTLTYAREYTPDFLMLARSGKAILIECKGHFPAAQRSKMLAVKRAHPDIDIRFLFANARERIGKNSKLNYGQWATKNGFKWAEGVLIPPDWFKE